MLSLVEFLAHEWKGTDLDGQLDSGLHRGFMRICAWSTIPPDAVRSEIEASITKVKEA